MMGTDTGSDALETIRDQAVGDAQTLFVKTQDGSGTPFVFLHGFGGDHEAWTHLANGLAGKAPSLAYDLPGHGRSGAHPARSPEEAAAAVATDLDRRGHARINLVGHSMGGAIAFLLALNNPHLIRSLFLIAPGGFGSEINQRLLRRFAEARQEDDITIALEQMVGWSFRLPRMLAPAIAAQRQDLLARGRLLEIVDTLLDGDGQKRLPVGEISKMPFPVRVIWGTQDRVLPTRQSHKLPGLAATHVFERVGHMPHMEIPQEILKILMFELER